MMIGYTHLEDVLEALDSDRSGSVTFPELKRACHKAPACCFVFLSFSDNNGEVDIICTYIYIYIHPRRLTWIPQNSNI